jgi:serine/threonine-protein kinase RsbW
MWHSMNRPERVRVLEALTGPDTLDKIHHALEELWADGSGVSDVARMNMKLATAEIGANIVKHARRGQPVRMRMEARLLAHEVEFVFTDDGDPVHVDLASIGMPDEMAEGGRGLAIAKAVVDRLTYRRDHMGNHWTLAVKR